MVRADKGLIHMPYETSHHYASCILGAFIISRQTYKKMWSKIRKKDLTSSFSLSLNQLLGRSLAAGCFLAASSSPPLLLLTRPPMQTQWVSKRPNLESSACRCWENEWTTCMRWRRIQTTINSCIYFGTFRTNLDFKEKALNHSENPQKAYQT